MIGELILSGYTYNEGREAINNAFSSQTFFNIFSATTIYSGDTELSAVFSTMTSSPTPFQQLVAVGETTTWNYSLGQNAKTTLSGNTALNITGISDGSSGLIIVKQDNIGSRILSLPTGSKVVNGGGGSILLTKDGDAEDILTFIYNGTNFYWNIGNYYN